VLEEKFYHPRVLVSLKKLRREERNAAEADKFLARKVAREKKNTCKRQEEFLRVVYIFSFFYCLIVQFFPFFYFNAFY
jgi:hypothetical protein